MRTFTPHTNETGHVVHAHHVTAETAGEVTVVGNPSVHVAPGHVLIATNRPEVFEVHTVDAFDLMGYEE